MAADLVLVLLLKFELRDVLLDGEPWIFGLKFFDLLLLQILSRDGG